MPQLIGWKVFSRSWYSFSKVFEIERAEVIVEWLVEDRKFTVLVGHGYGSGWLSILLPAEKLKRNSNLITETLETELEVEITKSSLASVYYNCSVVLFVISLFAALEIIKRY